MPASVKISSNSECGTRPSITVARFSPLRTARRQASIFGTIPEASSGSSCSSSEAVISVMISSLLGQSR